MSIFLESILSILIGFSPIILLIIVLVIIDVRLSKAEPKKRDLERKSSVAVAPNAVEDDGVVESLNLGSIDVHEDDAVSGAVIFEDSRENYVQTSSDENCGARECKKTSIDKSPERVKRDGIAVDSVDAAGVDADKSEEIQLGEVGDSVGVNSGEGGDKTDGLIMDDDVLKDTLLDEEDDWEGIEKTDLEKVFGAAVRCLESMSNADPLSSLGSDAKMRLYGLHKVATEGPCHRRPPMAFKVSARAQWNAWQQLGNMSPEIAMEQYIALLSEIIPSWMEDDIGGTSKWDFVDAESFRQVASKFKTSNVSDPGALDERTGVKKN